MNRTSVAQRIGLVAVAVATALVVVALAVVPFLNPAWVSFEQGRTGAAALTGYTPEQLRTVTDAIVADLVLGPPDFDVSVDGVATLTEAERSHMRDVRGAFARFFLLAAAAFGLLVAAFALAGRGDGSRRAVWRGVRAGSLGLAIGTAAAGVVALVAFDPAFEVFHRLLFASGTYLFDPATSKLVQLLPDALWSETAISVGAVIVVLALATAWLAGRRLRLAALEGRSAAPVAGMATPITGLGSDRPAR